MIVTLNIDFIESLTNKRQKEVYIDLVKTLSLFSLECPMDFVEPSKPASVRNIFNAFSNSKLARYTEVFLGKIVKYSSLSQDDKKKVFNEFRRQCISVCKKMQSLPERLEYNSGVISAVYDRLEDKPWVFLKKEDKENFELWIELVYEELNDDEEAQYEDMLCSIDRIVARRSFYKGCVSGAAIKAGDIVDVQGFLMLCNLKLVQKVWDTEEQRVSDTRHWKDAYNFDAKHFLAFKSRFVNKFLRPLAL